MCSSRTIADDIRKRERERDVETCSAGETLPVIPVGHGKVEEVMLLIDDGAASFSNNERRARRGNRRRAFVFISRRPVIYL